MIGRWLRANQGVSVKISTKVGAQPTHPGGFPDHLEGLTEPTVRRSLSESLERLGRDRVDLYWAHVEDLKVPLVLYQWTQRATCHVKRTRRRSRARRWPPTSASSIVPPGQECGSATVGAARRRGRQSWAASSPAAPTMAQSAHGAIAYTAPPMSGPTPVPSV